MPRQHTAPNYIAATLFFLTATVAADKPNLTGTWEMNPAKSDTGSGEKKPGGQDRAPSAATQNHHHAG